MTRREMARTHSGNGLVRTAAGGTGSKEKNKQDFQNECFHWSGFTKTKYHFSNDDGKPVMPVEDKEGQQQDGEPAEGTLKNR